MANGHTGRFAFDDKLKRGIGKAFAIFGFICFVLLVLAALGLVGFVKVIT